MWDFKTMSTSRGGKAKMSRCRVNDESASREQFSGDLLLSFRVIRDFAAPISPFSAGHRITTLLHQ